MLCYEFISYFSSHELFISMALVFGLCYAHLIFMILFHYCENTFNYPVFLVCVFTLDARSPLIPILWFFNAHFANFF